MFTGIIEELGEAGPLDWHGDSGVLTVHGPLVAADARHGDSIAVNGVCLTVVSVDGQRFAVDVMKETFDRSSLGTLRPGDPVNLERAATLATRLGGHLVQGHVDGVATVVGRTPGDRWEQVRFSLPAGLHRYVVEKGSIAVDGVSLTVTEVSDGAAGGSGAAGWFGVGLIPTTLQLTTLGRKPVGALVNLEVDVIAKYVAKQLDGARSVGGVRP
ncbi:riboflavin synthase alpha chain [Micromonospora sp. Llam0]|uniref:riboflavin synthase n=1 Tax=Micromonospora sp. Llam0 TaxID=2485143 RepID=UPI000F49F9D6|nr:riboflavin synthase [Micromonospora sp. Llam0]ROO59650.1 riboflavin synthase alpha chain [Micromonospora sp. Llam0]